jgi:hypothetical protein
LIIGDDLNGIVELGPQFFQRIRCCIVGRLSQRFPRDSHAPAHRLLFDTGKVGIKSVLEGERHNA